MVFFGSGVIRSGGVDFVGERAEVGSLFVYLDSCLPLSLNWVPLKTFVFRAGLGFYLGSVTEVLRYRRRTKICFAIVETIAVYVIADHTFRNRNNLVVHPDFPSSFSPPGITPASGVRAGGAFGQMPFVP